MYSILKKYLSDDLKNSLWHTVTKIIKKKLADVESRIPKYSLEQKHIANLKCITNRIQLLTLMPKNGVAAEIGVNKGDFTKLILETSQPKKLHLIDIWNTKRYHEGLKLDIQNRFRSNIEKGNVVINHGLSLDVVNDFENDYFDWIYIDTVHSYETTIAELNIYSNKVKSNGIIAGHDFTMGNWVNLIRYGVIEAVYEFCNKNNWEIVYITMDLEEYPSFAIRRIS